MTHPGTTVHTAPWVFTGERAIRHGGVAVAGGRIVATGDLRDVRGDAEVIEWPGTLTPGLVNAHTHLQYTEFSELGRTTYPSFEAWSEDFEVAYEQGGDWRRSAEIGLDAVIRSGTTVVGDVVTHAEAIDVLAAGNVHGIAYWEVMAWLSADWAEHGRDKTVEILHARKEKAVGLSPHSPYGLDTDVLRDLGVLAHEYGLRSHIHLAESAAEVDYVRSGTGPLADQWRAWGFGDFDLLRRGGAALRPVPYAESVGALGPHVHVAHGIYLDADDRAILRRTGTAVALCPRSNAVLGLDEAPVAAYLQEGNAIAVGTDSLASSPSLDVLADVSVLYGIARRQRYRGADLHRRLFEAVTAAGAAAMGLSGDLGTLEPGKLADLAVLDIDTSSAADTLAAVVEAGEGRGIGTVIAGEVRFRDPTAAASTRVYSGESC